MVQKRTVVLLVLGFALVAGIASLAVAVPLSTDGTGGASGSIVPEAKMTTKMIKIVYYDTGGVAHPVTLSDTPPGPTYVMTTYPYGGSTYYDDVIIKATASFSYESNGVGFVEIYDYDTQENYATKLIPNGKTVTVTTPDAIYVNETKNIGVLVSGEHWNELKQYYFRLALLT